MKKAKKDKLERILNSYFREIHKIYVAGDFREEVLMISLPKWMIDFMRITQTKILG